MNSVIASFTGEHRYLSNFFLVEVLCEGMVFRSVEHAYQVGKTLQWKEREKISGFSNPGDAKRYTRTSAFVVRSDWDSVKDWLMFALVNQKFQKPELRRLLALTSPAVLIEGNGWGDRYWGAEFAGGQWQGGNRLGKILMYIRDSIPTIGYGARNG